MADGRDRAPRLGGVCAGTVPEDVVCALWAPEHGHQRVHARNFKRAQPVCTLDGSCIGLGPYDGSVPRSPVTVPGSLEECCPHATAAPLADVSVVAWQPSTTPRGEVQPHS